MIKWLNKLNSGKKIEKECKKLTWCQLSEIIMDLEVKIHNHGESLPFGIFNKFINALEILEIEKAKRVKEEYDYERHVSLGFFSQMSDSDEF